MNRLSLLLCVCILPLLPLCAQLSVDAAGWTQLPPGPDSRLIYVSSSEGDDDNDGLSAAAPVATLARAASLARVGMPDHILLKTGDTFPTRFGLGNFHSGKSASEPTVISYYGDSDVRPIVDCEDAFLSVFQQPRSHIAIVGIDFYASNQDPNSDNFVEDVFHSSRTALQMIGFSGGNLLIEDCRFRYIGLGSFTAREPGDLTNIKIRRNIVVDAWADSTYFQHYSDGRNRQQGMYIEDTDGVLIEENLFDHNGWNDEVDGAGKNKFNHNIYMQVNNPNSDEIRVRGNILARASAHGIQMRSGGIATDNLFVQNSVNVNIGYPPQPPADRTATGRVADNVFLEVVRMDSTEENFNNPLRSGALWGVNTINLPAVVEDNIFAHALNTDTNVRAVGDYDDRHNLGGELQQSDNIVYRWFDRTEEPDPEWFDPNRMLGDYSRRLGLAPTTEAFLLRARERPLKTWWEDYTSYAVNDFIRSGFATDFTDAVPPPAPASAYVLDVTGETALIGWEWAFDDVRTRGYNVYLNGDLYTPSPVAADSILLTGLTFSTEYTVAIRTVDAGGNESTSAAEITFTTTEADNSAPSVPDTLRVTGKTASSITIAWQGATDNVAVNGYSVYLDGELFTDQLVADTFYTITGLAEAQTYRLSVSATDLAGNESAQSAELSVKTVDTQQPTDPSNVAAFYSDRTVRVSWSPSTDNDTLAGYNVYLNYAAGDEPVAFTEDTTASFEVTASPPYTIRVAAVDVSGNRSRLTQPVTAELSTSIRTVATDPAVAVYPNPARSSLYVVDAKARILRTTLFDLTGRIVGQSTAGPSTHRLDVSRLSAGPYLLRIELSGGHRLTQKLSIVH